MEVQGIDWVFWLKFFLSCVVGVGTIFGSMVLTNFSKHTDPKKRRNHIVIGLFMIFVGLSTAIGYDYARKKDYLPDFLLKTPEQIEKEKKAEENKAKEEEERRLKEDRNKEPLRGDVNPDLKK